MPPARRSILFALALALSTLAPELGAARAQAPAERATPEAPEASETSDTSEAPDPRPEPATHRKITRLRFAGWSFFTNAGLLFASIPIAMKLQPNDSDEASARGLATAVGLGMTSAALLTISGALLLRARMIVWRWEHDRERSVSLAVSPTGALLRLGF
ncbi:MAG: hypothetical protein ACOCUS_06835 [Polyangiales bacterium]